MCLSSVYTLQDEEPILLCKNVQNVTTSEDQTLVFTDIMGIRYTVKGRITNIDLINNTIDVQETKQASEA